MINSASNYNNNVDLKNENNSVSKILKMVKENSKVLEFGPAKGYMTKYLTENLNCEVTCIELNPEYKPYLEQYSRRVIVENIDNMDWNVLSKDFKSYDYLIFADVLEHLYDPWNALLNCRMLLKDSGFILASIPNIGFYGLINEILQGSFTYRPVGLLDYTHIRFFTRNSILEMFKEAGYNVDNVDTINNTLENSEFQTTSHYSSREILSILKKSKDAFVYQFVIKARYNNNANKNKSKFLPNYNKEKVSISAIKYFSIKLKLLLKNSLPFSITRRILDFYNKLKGK